MVDKTTSEFKSLDDINGGDIQIGCAESDNIKYFSRIMEKIQKKYPRIRCHLYSSGTDAVNERLERGLLDFAIIVQEVDLSKYNYLKMPASDRWGLIMRRDSPLAQKSWIEPEDLLGLPLICSRQSMTDEMQKWLGEMKKEFSRPIVMP